CGSERLACLAWGTPAMRASNKRGCRPLVVTAYRHSRLRLPGLNSTISRYRYASPSIYNSVIIDCGGTSDVSHYAPAGMVGPWRLRRSTAQYRLEPGQGAPRSAPSH